MSFLLFWRAASISFKRNSVAFSNRWKQHAVREIGEIRDDTTDRDGSSLETIDVQSIMEMPQPKSTTFTALPSDSRVEIKGPRIAEGSIILEDDGKSPKVLAYISVG
ncbi:hypothetical protein Y032_0081g1497 [Ancylostoma ceylanicum]|uniref:Uncharacterized protein n=1 Tax=Ancylostoma ceylanicum TaxID=53326 RepID=A0A016TSA4_9BILA|nr:hypothetical protein Y032_0081g1497 [Ancylostoma ceylanicum]